MTVYVNIEGFRFFGSKLQAPDHDELLLSDEFGAPELIADDGDALYSFPPGTTEREILFYLAGEAAGARGAIPPRSAESDIYGKLLTLIRHAAQQGIKIETLMHKALDRCDPEPPFSR
jgi:hypothetical protein